VWLVLAVLAVWLWRKPVVLPLVLIAWLAAEVTARLLKEVVTRERPHDHPLVAMLHTPSFPSGHATTGFACAATMARFAPLRRAAVVLYALAVLIAYSRVYVGVHYPLDVLGGAVLGLLIATALRLSLARFAFRSGLARSHRLDGRGSLLRRRGSSGAAKPRRRQR